MFSSGFVNLGKSEKQRFRIDIKKNLSVGKEKKKKFFLALRFRIDIKRYVKNCKGVRSTDFNL